MKRKEFLKEIAGLDKGALYAKATELAEELMRLRFKQSTRQLEQSHRLKVTRRALARVRSAISNRAKVNS